MKLNEIIEKKTNKEYFDLLLLELFHLPLGHWVKQIEEILVVFEDLNIFLQISADEPNNEWLPMSDREEIILDVLLLDSLCDC